MKFLPIFGALVAVTFAVPTPERIRTLFPERTELLDRIQSFGRLLAQDAHRIYRKSFDGFEVSDLDARLGQLFDGQDRLGEQIDRFMENEDSDEDESPQDMFRELISQLELDPDSMSALLSGEDRLVVDGKRMEYMMELLDKLSDKISDAIEKLDKDKESFLWRWASRQIKSAMEAILRVIESIRNAIEDAERAVSIDEELEIPGETLGSEDSEDTEIEHGIVDFGLEDDSSEDPDYDPRKDPDWERYQAEEAEEQRYRTKRSAALRRKRTVTTTSRRGGSFRLRRRHTGTPRSLDTDNSRNTVLAGGWSIGSTGLQWKNPKHRHHGGKL